jgi:hypothetical protein
VFVEMGAVVAIMRSRIRSSCRRAAKKDGGIDMRLGISVDQFAAQFRDASGAAEIDPRLRDDRRKFPRSPTWPQ